MPQRKKRKYVRRVVNIDQELCQARTELSNVRHTLDTTRKERDDLLAVNEDLRKQLRERGVSIEEHSKNIRELNSKLDTQICRRQTAVEQLRDISAECIQNRHHTVSYAITHVISKLQPPTV